MQYIFPNTLFVGQHFIFLEKVASTNKYALELIKNKPPVEGTLILANNQEQGKGQQNTSWEAIPGKNLTLSLILYPKHLFPKDQFVLSQAVALAVLGFCKNVLELEGLRNKTSLPLSRGQFLNCFKIKWPNDIYYQDEKIAGILIENSISSNSINHSIIGIGININQDHFSENIKNATSLKNITGKEFELKILVEQLCGFIEQEYLAIKSMKDNRQLKERYLQNLYKFEVPHFFTANSTEFEGIIKDITETGKLVVETKYGREEFGNKEIVFSKQL